MKKIQIKYNIDKTYREIMKLEMDKLGLEYSIGGLSDIKIIGKPSDESIKSLSIALEKYGIEIVNDPREVIVQNIKDIIIDIIHNNENIPNMKLSVILAEKLNYSFGFLSKLFSETTFNSIESYIIFQKLERVKMLLASSDYTLTEISLQMNYSSVAHLSNQFKKVTGVSPTAFQRIIIKRKLRMENNSPEHII